MRRYKPWQLGLGCLIGTGILVALLIGIFLVRVVWFWVATGSWEPLRMAWGFIF